MNKEEFTRRLSGDKALQRRFVADPGAVLAEFGVETETELSDDELGNVAGGLSGQPAFVHGLLMTIFENRE